MPYFYAVTATLPDDMTAREYVAWLVQGHVEQVVAAGATASRVVRLDRAPGETPQVETQYVFPSRAAFEHYLATDAPALRAEGLAKFPPARGITMARRGGEVMVV